MYYPQLLEVPVIERGKTNDWKLKKKNLTEVTHTVGRPYSDRVNLKNGRCKETGKKKVEDAVDLIETKIFILDYRAEIKIEGGIIELMPKIVNEILRLQ